MERPALFVTIVSEPPVKMLGYQQQFSLFDATRVGKCIRYHHLGGELQAGGIEQLLTASVTEVEATSPQVVFIDSFRAEAPKAVETGPMAFQSFTTCRWGGPGSWLALTDAAPVAATGS